MNALSHPDYAAFCTNAHTYMWAYGALRIWMSRSRYRECHSSAPNAPFNNLKTETGIVHQFASSGYTSVVLRAQFVRRARSWTILQLVTRIHQRRWIFEITTFNAFSVFKRRHHVSDPCCRDQSSKSWHQFAPALTHKIAWRLVNPNTFMNSCTVHSSK